MISVCHAYEVPFRKIAARLISHARLASQRCRAGAGRALRLPLPPNRLSVTSRPRAAGYRELGRALAPMSSPTSCASRAAGFQLRRRRLSLMRLAADYRFTLRAAGSASCSAGAGHSRLRRCGDHNFTSQRCRLLAAAQSTIEAMPEEAI